jgi:type I restriction enzyme S subunit
MAPDSRLRVRLGTVASVKARLGWKGLKAEEYLPTGCYFLSTPNLKGRRIDFDQAHFISQWRYDESPEIQLRLGDILLVKDGSTLGIANLVRSLPGPTTVNGSVAVVRPGERLESQYLFQYVQANEFQNLIRLKRAGLGVPHLFQADLREFELELPPLPEQRRIAEILDTLDEAIRNTEQLIDKLKQVKQGLQHDLLTRGVDDKGAMRDPDRHPEHFKDSPVGRIPRDWTHQHLGALARRITDGTHQAVRTVSEGSTTVPFLYVSCVRDGQIRWDAAAQVTRRTFTEISKGREPAAGMVLYTAVGSFGHAAVVTEPRDFAFQRHIACIYPDLHHVASAFLGMWLNSSCIRQHGERVAIGNAQRSVTLGELVRFPVPLPSMVEQRRIAEIGAAADAQIEAEHQRLGKIRLLKRGLMDDLLTGRVRVTNYSG